MMWLTGKTRRLKEQKRYSNGHDLIIWAIQINISQYLIGIKDSSL